MKKMISTVILAVMAVMAFSQTESNETYQRLTGIPKPPVAGTTISFEYHPQGGPLEGMKDLVALVYMYRDYRWTLADTALADNGNGSWSGSLLIPTDCAFMAFQFQSTWDQFTQTKDNNDNQGGTGDNTGDDSDEGGNTGGDDNGGGTDDQGNGDGGIG